MPDRQPRQGVNRTPHTTLALGVGEHTVGRAVGAVVFTILAGDGTTLTDAVKDGLATSPAESLHAAMQSATTALLTISFL